MVFLKGKESVNKIDMKGKCFAFFCGGMMGYVMSDEV